MLGDILLIGPQHTAAAKVIAERVLAEKEGIEKENPEHKYVVAISGESGSGKSELAHSLALLLRKEGARPKILHTDNYYLVPPTERKAYRVESNFEEVGLDEYDWRLLNRNIDEYRFSREAMLPCVDIVTDEVDQLLTDFSKVDVLVVDGLYAMGIEGADLCIYIDLTWHETKKNQELRGKESTDYNRMQVLEKEHEGVRSLRHLADLIVDRSYQVVDAADFYSSSSDREYEYVLV
jgi:uridine kinase